MMNNFSVTEKTLGECWLAAIGRVMECGSLAKDEDVSIKEILGLSVRIEEPNDADDIIYRFGNHGIIDHTVEKFNKGTVMTNRPFTYGDCIYNKNGVDQFEWLIKRIEHKPETKSATISLLTEGNSHPNLPCLNLVDVKIRNNKVNLQFFFRSQNIVGRQYANFIALAKLQKKIADRLSMDTGIMAGYIASAHIYEYDFDYAKAILGNQVVVIEDKFYTNGPKSIRENLSFK